MGKALLVYGPDSTHVSGEEMGLIGAASDTIEASSQYEATEGATFSGLARQFLTGGSGTNTLRFRVNATNGNQVAAITGAGFAEDTTNTDVLAAGDLFNAAHTDTGSNLTDIIFIRSNVAFASGHGCFHGAANPVGQLYTTSSNTRYIAISGQTTPGGSLSIVGQQWKVRGYSTCEAIQVRVLTNNRVNSTTVRLNVNGTDVGTTLTIGAGVTGLRKITGLGQALADGNNVCLSATFGVGTQDLIISLWGVTLKSTTYESETWCHAPTGMVRTASAAADYFCVGGILTDLLRTEAQIRVKVGFACRISNLRTYLEANTYTGAATVKLYVNGSAALTTTVPAGTDLWSENTTDHVIIGANDEISFEIDSGTSGSATFNAIGITFSPIPIQVFSFEHGHEALSTGISGLVSFPGTPYESGWEVLSGSLTQDYNLAVTTAEFDWEARSVPLNEFLVVESAELGHESELVGIVQAHNLTVQESEYGFEAESLGQLESHVIVQESEYGFEAESAALVQTYTLTIEEAELGWEVDPASLELIVAPETLECGFEIDSLGIDSETSMNVQSVEFDFETGSAFLRHLQSAITPTDRRLFLTADRRTWIIARDSRSA